MGGKARGVVDGGGGGGLWDQIQMGLWQFLFFGITVFKADLHCLKKWPKARRKLSQAKARPSPNYSVLTGGRFMGGGYLGNLRKA